MATHLYLSQNTGDLFSYRGECGPGDDPQAFARVMERLGYEVIIAATGQPAPAVGLTGRISTSHWRDSPRRNIEVIL
jgi:hypothetical protein